MRLINLVRNHIAVYLTFYVGLMMLVMLLSLGIMSFSIITMTNQRAETYENYGAQTVFETYRSEGIEEAYKATNGMAEYFEFLNSRKQVKDEVNSPRGFGYTYSETAFRELAEKDKEYLLYYPYRDSEDVFVMYAPKLAGPTPIVDIVIYHIMAFVLLVAGLMALMVLHVRRQLVGPMLLMKHAVEEIGAGTSEVKIEYKSKNELNILKTAIEQMGMTIHNQVAALKQAEEERKRMVLSLSHDIRTPLTNISGYAETLKSDLNLTKEEQLKAIDVIYNNTQRAKNLVSGLFDYSKYDSEQLAIQMKPTDIVASLRECVINCYPDFEMKGVSIDLQLPESPLIISLDPMLFDRLIGNLLTNSLRYAYDRCVLSVQLSAHYQFVKITIQDQGPGIPESIRETLFNPFVTGDEARTQRSGTGLGLTIAKRLSERLGGRLEWDQSYKKGVRWHIYLMYH